MKLTQISVLLIVAMTIIACGPTKSDRNRIVNQYHQESEFYKVTFRMNSETSSYEVYVIADDKYEVSKLLDEKYAEDTVTILSMDEISFLTTQPYPYGN